MESNKSYVSIFSTLETFDCWTWDQSFCFLINRTDMFSPLKALQLPRVINLLQLNYCTKHTPVSEGDWKDCGRSTEIWICINSMWQIESSQRVMRICRKIMRRINHCRFTRHLGRGTLFMCVLQLKWRRNWLSANYELIHILQNWSSPYK